MEHFSQTTEPGHLSEDLLNEYLDGYLAPEVSVTVEKHLAQCPACTQRYHRMQTFFAALEDLPDIPLQRDLSRQVVNAIHSQPHIPAFIKWSMLPQLAIAVFILLTLLPQYLRGWLAVLANAVDVPFAFSILSWFAEVRGWLFSLQFSLPGGQLSSLNFDIQLPAFHNINWLLFAVMIALLMITNGYLLRQVGRNGSD
jgi:hypothetical protein